MKQENNTQKVLEELISKFPKEQIPELVKAAAKAQTAEEVKAIARDNGVELTDEQAELLLKVYSEELPLPEDYLSSISGGAGDREPEPPSKSCFD